MEEYKYIQISDDSDATNAALKRLVDEYLTLIPRNYLYSIEKKSGKLILSWSTWHPTGVEKPFFKTKACEITHAASLENRVLPRFRLPPSLDGALREIQSNLAGGKTPNTPYPWVEALRLWGLVDADYDHEFVDATYGGPSQGTLWFRAVLKEISLVPKGEEYLRKGFLTDPRRGIT